MTIYVLWKTLEKQAIKFVKIPDFVTKNVDFSTVRV